ncbi:MAG: hypothetical protein JSR99_12185 [Proteobacteria bacterium]|nr:hypothetical protein [Pseudomonadota bacterium]
MQQLSESDRPARCPKAILANSRIEACEVEAWNRIKSKYRPLNVFVNFPYDKAYQPIACTVIATLFKCGLRPQMAALKSSGAHRLCKICEMIQQSKYCLTDLSYSTLHNMPFELGYSMALGRIGHQFVLVDQKYVTNADSVRVRKFDSQLSNMKGVIEPITYDGDKEKLANELVKRIQDSVPEAPINSRANIKRDEIISEIMQFSKEVQKALKKGSLDEFLLAAEFIGLG